MTNTPFPPMGKDDPVVTPAHGSPQGPGQAPGLAPALAPGVAAQPGPTAPANGTPTNGATDQPASGPQTIGEATAHADAAAAAATSATPSATPSGARAIYDVPLDVQIVLGHAQMTVDSVMKLGRGAVVEIERKVGDAVDVCINNHMVARGEVVLVDGEKLGVALTEVVGGLTH